MPHAILFDRVTTCPECLSDNELIGSDLVPGIEIHCSQCGAQIGLWSDTRDRHVESVPHLGKAKGPAEAEP